MSHYKYNKRTCNFLGRFYYNLFPYFFSLVGYKVIIAHVALRYLPSHIRHPLVELLLIMLKRPCRELFFISLSIFQAASYKRSQKRISLLIVDWLAILHLQLHLHPLTLSSIELRLMEMTRLEGSGKQFEVTP